MKEKLFFLAIISLLIVSCKPKESEAQKIQGLDKDFFKKASYVMGYDLGKSSLRDTLNIDIDEFLKGFKAGQIGDSTSFSSKELDSIRMLLQDYVMMRQNDRQKEERKAWQKNAPINKQKSDSFMLANKTKEGVVTTNSGLQYIILKSGKGLPPDIDDIVKFHVVGYYMDGSKFDDTYEKQPIQMPLNAMMPGWKEAFSMMTPGSKWKIFLPPELGFGEKGMQPLIPSNVALIFEIEFISIEGKAPNKSNPGILQPPH